MESLGPNPPENILTYLHKQGELILWGKINIIKMVITPQVNYVSMIVPMCAAPQLFKQYDVNVKN